ncbi:MAG: hypothetical protein APF81_13250 [Desulfosporosinus sp. BRH_c37]|nr:MAG: hypothetical protein APF81_13250 [Desulfosporosinus sp. BRH_c37]
MELLNNIFWHGGSVSRLKQINQHIVKMAVENKANEKNILYITELGFQFLGKQKVENVEIYDLYISMFNGSDTLSTTLI